MKKYILSLLLLVGFLTVLGIVFVGNKDSSKSEVTVSFYPIQEFTSKVLSDKTVLAIVPAGVEAHDYEPTPQDIVAISNSKLFIYNGNDLEPWAQDVYESVGSESRVEILNISKELNTSRADPHFWLDPVLAIDMVNIISTKLSLIYPSKSNEITENTNIYINELQNLDYEFRAGLSDCRKDKIIVSHDAFEYLGRRYGFEIISVSGISPESEPSAQKIAGISEIIKKEQLGYVFSEENVSRDIAETIGKETGAKILVLNPIESLSDEEKLQGQDYLSIMRSNLVNLRTAMECQ